MLVRVGSGIANLKAEFDGKRIELPALLLQSISETAGETRRIGDIFSSGSIKISTTTPRLRCVSYSSSQSRSEPVWGRPPWC